ncbi:hypothetical protein D917_06531 [Trichinella nativa]|uniref:Uncharacterized protein n=1 Tax=Trichinella nativa TaxID=6335 RepID=A0A1Y3ES32_9BILA|nr:hypothetical protein D917_06531 [Trichinella nativa]
MPAVQLAPRFQMQATPTDVTSTTTLDVDDHRRPTPQRQRCADSSTGHWPAVIVHNPYTAQSNSTKRTTDQCPQKTNRRAVDDRQHVSNQITNTRDHTINNDILAVIENIY